MFQNVLENLPGVDPNSEAVQQVIKINSQKTMFSNIKVVAKINKTLKINSGETLKQRYFF